VKEIVHAYRVRLCKRESERILIAMWRLKCVCLDGRRGQQDRDVAVQLNLLVMSSTSPPQPLLTRTCFYRLHALQSHHLPFTRHRHEIDRSPLPQTCPIRPALRYRTRLLAVIHMPLKYIIETPPTIVSSRKQVVCLWTRCRPGFFWTNSFLFSRCPKVSELEGVFRECLGCRERG
jgi:hypothetical protein